MSSALGQRLFADSKLPLIAGIGLLGLLWGGIVAVAELNALYLAASLVGCAFILFDFRVGVALLVLLLPISRSSVFPHAMLGITGLNPFNLLLVGTLGSCVLHGLVDGSLRRFVPRPLALLYLLPIIVGAALGVRHVGDIAPDLIRYDLIGFSNASGYVAEIVLKPLVLVVFALLVKAAAERSEEPERFLVPMLISIWIICLIEIVFVVDSGVSLFQLANSEARAFLSRLGLHANELGTFYCVAFGLCLFVFGATDRRGLKLVLAATMALVLGALMLTFSRGAFSALVVIGALYTLWHRSVRTFILAALVVLVALIALPDAVYYRVTTGFGHGWSAISAGRTDTLWLPLLPEVWKSPIWGSGLGSMLWSAPVSSGQVLVTHPHNAYLEVALDLGIAGLIALLSYFVLTFKGFRALAADASLSPTMRGFYLGAAAALIGLGVAEFFNSGLLPRPEQTFLWFAIGMMYGQHNATFVDRRQ